METLVEILDEKLKKSAFLRRAAVKGEVQMPDSSKRISRFYRFKGYCALIIFSFRGVAPGVRNFLECRLFENEKDLLYIPLSRLTPVLTDGYRYLEYPYVATKEQMAEAMDQLLSNLEELDPAISSFFRGGADKARVYTQLVDEVNAYCGEKVLLYNGRVAPADEEIELRALYKMLRFFYASRIAERIAGPFNGFFYDRPVHAMDAMAAHQRRDGEIESILSLSADRVQISSLQKQLYLLAKRQSGVAILPALLLSILGCTLLLGPVLALFCLALYYFAAGGFDSSVLYHTALQGEYYLFALLPLFFSGFLWLSFDDRPVFFLLYGKKRFKDYAAALHSPGERRATGIVGSLILSGLIVISFLSGRCGVAFKEDHFEDQSSYFSLESTNYSYDKIKEAATLGAFEETDDVLLLILEDGRGLYLGRAEEHAPLLKLLEEKQVPFTEYADKQALYEAHPHFAPNEEEAESPEMGEN